MAADRHKDKFLIYMIVEARVENSYKSVKFRGVTKQTNACQL